VLFDEFDIAGVARNMHFDREASLPVRAHYFSGRLYIMDSVVDKRLLFFPFLVSLVHDLTGYRPENVFYVNAGLSAILLLLVYAFGFGLGGQRLGCLGVLLLAGLPLIAQNATGGGHELANLVMILLFYFLGCRYFRSAGAEGLNLFILAAVLLAQVRYESILYVLVVPAVAFCKWRREGRITLTWLAALSPALLLAPLLSNEVFMSEKDFFQTLPGQAFFSLHYLPDNLGRAIYYLFNPGFGSTNSFLLSASGLFAAGFFALLLLRNIGRWYQQRSPEIVLVGIALVVVGTTLLGLVNFWGQWDDPLVSRFSLPLQLLMVLLILRIAVEFLKTRLLPKWGPMVAGAWLVLFAAPASAQHFLTTDIVTAGEYRWYLDFLSHKDPSETLTLSGSSLGPIIYNRPAISFDAARAHRWEVNACLDGEFYREIIVLQRFKLDFKTGKYVETGPSLLGAGFKLETIAERRFRPYLVSRISRLVEVDLTHVSAPPGFDAEKPPFENNDAMLTHLWRKLP
jgi:hypothetical protein